MILKNEISLQMANMSLISLFLQESSEIKFAKVIAIHNKGSKLKCWNYRPISRLSTLDKILEKMVYNRICDFLEKYKLIHLIQFGFRQHYSTSYALLNLTESIIKVLDEGNFARGIFFDLQNPFDSTDHNILLKKLNYYGIRGISDK